MILLRAATLAALAALAAATTATTPQLTLAAAGGLTLKLDPTTLAYSVSVDGAAWFDTQGEGAGGGYGYSADGKAVTLGGKGMKAIGAPAKSAGSDAAGAFASLAVSFSRSGSAPAEWIATFKTYTGRSAIAFAQTWPKGEANSKGGSVFPALHKAAPAAVDMGTLEYTGSSCGFMVSASQARAILPFS
jgi:hypothetical protein